MDDFVEEQKLSSSRRVSFPWQPEVWAGSSEPVEEGGEGGGERGEMPAQLRELLKTEREQKVCINFDWIEIFPFFQNYFEELVSVRDNQLSRLQLELTSAGEERERERAELEVVILELQQQL